MISWLGASFHCACVCVVEARFGQLTGCCYTVV